MSHLTKEQFDAMDKNDQSDYLNQLEHNQDGVVVYPVKDDFAVTILHMLEEVEDYDLVQILKHIVNKQISLDYMDLRTIEMSIEQLYWENHPSYVSQQMRKQTGYNIIQHQKYSKRTPRASKTQTRTYQPYTDWKKFSKDQKNVRFVLSALATAKTFKMMKMYPNIEWGAYMVLDEKLPEKDEILNLSKDDTIRIEVEDILLIPQKRSTVRVEYLEQELPEFMHQWKEAKLNNKYVSSARIHSHHKMDAYHSSVDMGELVKEMDIGNRFISTVLTLKEVPDGEIDFDNYMKNIRAHSLFAIPMETAKERKEHRARIGYLLDCGLSLTRFEQEHIDEANSFYEEFNDMEEFIQENLDFLLYLDKLVEQGIVDEVEHYEMRLLIFENQDVFNFMKDLLGFTQKFDMNKFERFRSFIEAVNNESSKLLPK